MRASPLVICCWPGLPRLWLLGDWLALVVAVGFGAVVNLLLVSTLMRPHWLPSPIGSWLWLSLGGLWFVSAIRAYRNLPHLCQPAHAADDRGLFLRAQGEYLQGHWFEAESQLCELLRRCPGDADARLMLATLYRRTRRNEEAAQELVRMERLDDAKKWQWEIARERKLLEQNCDATLDEDR